MLRTIICFELHKMIAFSQAVASPSLLKSLAFESHKLSVQARLEKGNL